MRTLAAMAGLLGAGAVASVILTASIGQSQAPERARLPMVAGDSATYAPAAPSVSPTSTPTRTATATATPTRTPSPTPIPTPDVDSCYEQLCLRAVSAYAQGNQWHVVGEVVNNGEGAGARAEGVHLEVTFFDGAGDSIASATGGLLITVLAGANDEVHLGSRNVAPFHAVGFAPPGVSQWTTYSVRITAANRASTGLARNLNVVASETLAGGAYEATGYVNNLSGRTVSSVTVVVALYSGGNVVRVATVATTPSTLNDRGHGNFTLTIADAPFDAERTQDFWVDAIP